VRSAIRQYLETGKLPSAPAWPLPETEGRGPVKAGQKEFPMVETLIDIAIAEKQPAEVIRWYDYYLRLQRKTTDFWTGSRINENNIAEAIAGDYPERAVAIWKKLAEDQIALTQPSAYETAAPYLAGIRRVLVQMGKEEEWKSYVAGLQSANIRKRRFLEVLIGLNGKPIVET
jgi:uncharacterized Zn finger protein